LRIKKNIAVAEVVIKVKKTLRWTKTSELKVTAQGKQQE
jgi:hypothetical protein